MIPLYEVSRISKFLETENRLKITRGWGEDGEFLFNGYRVSVWGDEKVLGIDSGEVCTAW